MTNIGAIFCSPRKCLDERVHPIPYNHSVVEVIVVVKVIAVVEVIVVVAVAAAPKQVSSGVVG